MVLSQVKRVLKDQGLFLCCVPVPERIEHGKKVRGRLYSEAELERLFISRGFSFEAVPFDNGALLYFRAVTTGADPTSALRAEICGKSKEIESGLSSRPGG
jgi:hypothetical protein